jgi:hypothetical protein
MIDDTACEWPREWTALYVYVCRNAYIRRSLFGDGPLGLASVWVCGHSLTEALGNGRCSLTTDSELIEGKMTRCGDEDAEERTGIEAFKMTCRGLLSSHGQGNWKCQGEADRAVSHRLLAGLVLGRSRVRMHVSNVYRNSSPWTLSMHNHPTYNNDAACRKTRGQNKELR